MAKAKYKHPEIESRLEIKKQYGMAVVVYLIDEPKVYNLKGKLNYPTRIVNYYRLTETS